MDPGSPAGQIKGSRGQAALCVGHPCQPQTRRPRHCPCPEVGSRPHGSPSLSGHLHGEVFSLFVKLHLRLPSLHLFYLKYLKQFRCTK